jgi:phospholipase/carboxylesterase
MPDFVHRYIPADLHAGITLVLLHGTGGDENDLLPIGRRLLPVANLLSVRGKVLENGAPRYFRRLREGVFDEQDLRFRTNELADFLQQFHGPFVAAGYSNGANIAASILLLRPEVFEGAMLFRAMVPLEPEQAPDLAGKTVFLAGGKQDPIVPAENTRKLAGMLKSYGAQLTLHWEEAGHALTDAEVETAKAWARAFAPESA